MGGGFLIMLLPPPGKTRPVSGWSLIGGSVLLATGVVLGTVILAA
jgi:hypothetical protein